MSWTNRLLALAAILGVLALLAWAFVPRPIEIEAASVSRGVFLLTIDEDGKTRVRDRYVVSAPLAGRLARIDLNEGDAVAKDGPLAGIAPTMPALLDARTEQELKGRVGAADAAKLRAGVRVERAKVALEQARADLERTRKLAAQSFVSPTKLEADELVVKLNQKELDAAREEVHVADHDLEVARAALLQVRSPGPQRLWEVRSPIAGRVLRVLQKSEGAVTIGTPLLELADPTRLEVVVDVLTSDAVRIQPGARVLFERWGGTDALEGRVRLIEPSAFTKVSALGVEEQRVNVIVDIVSPAGQWQRIGDGYRVEARIVVESRQDALKVPVGALFRDGAGWAVFTIAGGRASKRPVEIGQRNGVEALVAKGLEPQEKVIVYPGDSIEDGVRVAVRRET